MPKGARADATARVLRQLSPPSPPSGGDIQRLMNSGRPMAIAMPMDLHAWVVGSHAVRNADAPLPVLLKYTAMGVMAGFPVGSEWPTVGGAVADAITAVSTLRNKCVRLDPMQGAVIGALKQTPLSTADLAERLASTDPNETGWDMADVERVLGELQSLQLHDGSKAPFVRLDADGRWRSLA